MESWEKFLEEREQARLIRRLSPSEERRPGIVVREGKEFVDFSSNDYLGLSSHPAVVAAARDALERYGVGAGASRLMSGSLSIHHELEEEIAAFKGTERALVFNSGYHANIGIVPALFGRHDLVVADVLSHASQLDGALLSRAKLIRFRHNDPEHLLVLLDKYRDKFRKCLVMTESVFSMDGDLAPLRDLLEICRRRRCLLMVDEAHATGVFGAKGKGRVEAEGLAGEVDLVMGTFSKALGGFGAYLAASRVIVEFLVNSARSFIYSTALPAAVIAANLAALRLCLAGETRGGELLRRSSELREKLREMGWTVGGDSQIVPVMIGESGRAVALSDSLAGRGFLVLPVRPPTVPEGSARLRFSVTTAHANSQINGLLYAISAA
ncbi:MAG: 8-amino-7-oxononanoate synthase [Syntrophorhabdaceae bacterium]|nr:8-amino-7-oxononanoate synthase [Syntrophorhabdaceae bacterium]